MKSLLLDISQFLRRSGMSASAFGRDAVNDPRFVHDLRNGRQCGGRVRRRVYSFIDARDRNAGQCG
ncbi:MAG: hypothetical protein HKN78_04130 [Sphingomonadaceae bacterium]|nr:hypothetical protein [Sphingomonadaceae bacterium]